VEAASGFVAWLGVSLVVLSDGRRGLALGMALGALGLAGVSLPAAEPIGAIALVAGGAVAAARRFTAGPAGWAVMPAGSTPRLVARVPRAAWGDRAPCVRRGLARVRPRFHTGAGASSRARSPGRRRTRGHGGGGGGAGLRRGCARSHAARGLAGRRWWQTHLRRLSEGAGRGGRPAGSGRAVCKGRRPRPVAAVRRRRARRRPCRGRRVAAVPPHLRP